MGENDKRAKKSKRKVWLIAGLILPVLYVMSSGPTFSMALSAGQVKYEKVAGTDGTERLAATIEISPSPWWQVAYAPLVLASGTTWGEPIASYWEYCCEHAE